MFLRVGGPVTAPPDGRRSKRAQVDRAGEAKRDYFSTECCDMGCAITTEYIRRGIETAFLENDHLRVEVLTGKGDDITEIRDKRTDVNVLFEAPHRWQAPSADLTGVPDESFAFLNHYLGGWQDVLPGAGGPATVQGAPLALHGESTLVPWDATVTEQTAGRMQLSLPVSLARYLLSIERSRSRRASRR